MTWALILTLLTLAKGIGGGRHAHGNESVQSDFRQTHWSPGLSIPEHSVDKTCRLSLAAEA